LRSDRERLFDILESVERIEAQAARGLTEELRRAHPEVPWRQMVAMRNVLIHGYFDIDVDLIWSVAENDLPKLGAQIRAVLEELV
jgi:uncharacterized protein with HEPN domain